MLSAVTAEPGKKAAEERRGEEGRKEGMKDGVREKKEERKERRGSGGWRRSCDVMLVK